MSDSTDNDSTTEESKIPETIVEETVDPSSMIVLGSEKDDEQAREDDSSSSSYKDADKDADAGGIEGSTVDDPDTKDTGDLGEGGEGGEDSSSGDDIGASDEASVSDEGGISDESSDDTSSSEMPGLEKPGKMVSRALEYDLQDMYPEVTLLFEDKQSAWNCQDPAIIRAMWLESKTNILREWKFRNGKIKSKEKPKLEVKPTVTVTLRKQHLEEQAKMKDWKEMYIPPGNDPPHYKQLQLPTNVTTEVRYNFTRNNPPVPSSYVLHYEKYKRPPFNVYQPQKCNKSVHL